MTEDRAKTKMCCGPPSVAASAYYRAGAACDAPMHCIASDCMAWRRQTVMIDRATGEPAIPGVTAIGSLEERYSAHGYCGLAGEPK